MISKRIKVAFEEGREARSLAMLVNIAGKYESSIQLERRGRRMNAKSIMGMMALSPENGDEVEIFAEGPDEEAALAELEQFLQSGGTE